MQIFCIFIIIKLLFFVISRCLLPPYNTLVRAKRKIYITMLFFICNFFFYRGFSYYECDGGSTEIALLMDVSFTHSQFLVKFMCSVKKKVRKPN